MDISSVDSSQKSIYDTPAKYRQIAKTYEKCALALKDDKSLPTVSKQKRRFTSDHINRILRKECDFNWFPVVFKKFPSGPPPNGIYEFKLSYIDWKTHSKDIPLLRDVLAYRQK